MEVQRAPTQSALLAQAFSDFISASASLELSYRDLQAEVAELSMTLLERNQALAESLSENRAMDLKLERILDAMPCGVLVVHGTGAVRLANPEAARLLALSAAQMPTLYAIHNETGLDLYRNGFDPHMDEEQELSFESSAGRHWIAVRRVRLSVAVTSSDQAEGGAGAGVEVVLMLRDISARKRMEQEREAAREAVAFAQVSAILAHEIRNPLASLELFAGLVADNPERRDEWLSHLRAGIRALSGTVNNVLTLHAGGTPTIERFDVLAEAAVAVSFLQPLAQQVGVALILETVPEINTEAQADAELQSKPTAVFLKGNRTAFHQLLLNLCSNALRHSTPDGTVRVVCPRDREATTLRISVVDSGCGIAEEHLPRLFESGFSGSGATPGLGLAVCARLMQQHGGHIHVQSRPGHGSTFTLEFPQA